MTNSRLAIRVLLVVILGLVGVVAVMKFRVSRGTHFISRAENFREAGNMQGEKDALNALVQNVKDDGKNTTATLIKGHRRLAEIYLEEAKAAGKPHEYKDVTPAMNHLILAASMSPDDIELQETLMEEFVNSRRLFEASQVAVVVLKAESDNSEAAYWLTWYKVNAGKLPPEEMQGDINKLQGMKAHPVFRTHHLKLQFTYARKDLSNAQKPGEINRIIEAAFDSIRNRTGKQIADLAPIEQDALIKLVISGIAFSTNSKQAVTRTQDALTTFKEFRLTGKADSQKLASAGTSIISALQTKTPQGGGARAWKAWVNKQSGEFAKLRDAAIEEGDATTKVYWQAATSAWKQKQYNESLDLINKGVKAAQQLPDEGVYEALSLHLLGAQQLLSIKRYDAAQLHLDAILAHAKPTMPRRYGSIIGRTYLIQGSSELAQGKTTQAIDSYRNAKKQLGEGFLVQAEQAKAYREAEKWNDAKRELLSLNNMFDPENEQTLEFRTKRKSLGQMIKWQLADTCFKLGQREEAFKYVKELKGTPLESRAFASAADFEWSKPARSREEQRSNRKNSMTLLNHARESFPDSFVLMKSYVNHNTEAGKADVAEEELQKFIERHSNVAEVRLFWVRWLLKQNPARIDDAAVAVKAFEMRFPGNPDASVLRGLLLIAQGKTELALKVAERLKVNPNTAEQAATIYGAAELGKQGPRGFVETLKLAVNDAPIGATAMLTQGRAFIAKGRYDLALTTFLKLLEIDEFRTDAEHAISVLHTEAIKRNYDLQKSVLQPALEKLPHDPFLHKMNAISFLGKGQTKEAMVAAELMIEYSVNPTEGHYLQGLIWMTAKQPNRALASLKRALETGPGHLPSLVLAAKAADADGQPDNAMRFAQQALRVNPRQDAMFLLIASSQHKVGKTQEAIATIQSLIAMNPKNGQAYQDLAFYYNYLGDIETAVQIYEAGQQQLPNNYDIVRHTIATLYRADRREQALKFADKVAGSNADTPRAIGLSELFLSLGDFSQSRLWLNKAAGSTEDQYKPAILLLAGRTSLAQAEISSLEPAVRQKYLTDARDKFAGVLQMQPKNLMATNNLAWLLATEFNAGEKAVALCEGLRGQTPLERVPPSMVDTMVVAYRAADRLDESRQLLRRALKLWPDNPQLLYEYGRFMAEDKHFAMARSNFIRALKLGVTRRQAEDIKRQLILINEELTKTTSEVDGTLSPQPASP